MKRFCMMLFSVMMILSLIFSFAYAVRFSDLKETFWAYKEIEKLTDEGIINGYTDGTYKPEKAVTRGEFLKLIMVALYGGNEYFEKNNFNLGHWATPYALEAVRLGYLMDGTTINNLNDSITRREMVNILAKICIDNSIKAEEQNESIEFLDTSDLDENTKLFIEFVTTNGLINGYTDQTFKPTKYMTRAEVAVVMNRFLNLMQ